MIDPVSYPANGGFLKKEIKENASEQVSLKPDNSKASSEQVKTSSTGTTDPPPESNNSVDFFA